MLNGFHSENTKILRLSKIRDSALTISTQGDLKDAVFAWSFILWGFSKTTVTESVKSNKLITHQFSYITSIKWGIFACFSPAYASILQ